MWNNTYIGSVFVIVEPYICLDYKVIVDNSGFICSGL